MLGSAGGPRNALPLLPDADFFIINGDTLTSGRGPEYVTASTVEESVEMVLAGKADYALLDDLVVQYLTTNFPDQVKTRLAIGTTPLIVRTLHFALRRDIPGAISTRREQAAREHDLLRPEGGRRLCRRVGRCEGRHDQQGAAKECLLHRGLTATSIGSAPPPAGAITTREP